MAKAGDLKFCILVGDVSLSFPMTMCLPSGCGQGNVTFLNFRK